MCKHWTVRTANLALVKSENIGDFGIFLLKAHACVDRPEY